MLEKKVLNKLISFWSFISFACSTRVSTRTYTWPVVVVLVWHCPLLWYENWSAYGLAHRKKFCKWNCMEPRTVSTDDCWRKQWNIFSRHSLRLSLGCQRARPREKWTEQDSPEKAGFPEIFKVIKKRKPNQDKAEHSFSITKRCSSACTTYKRSIWSHQIWQNNYHWAVSFNVQINSWQGWLIQESKSVYSFPCNIHRYGAKFPWTAGMTATVQFAITETLNPQHNFLRICFCAVSKISAKKPGE